MDQSVEQWRPVVGWEGFYEVSDLGRVRSLDRVCHSYLRGPQRWKGCLLTAKINHNRSGYRQVALTRKGHPHYAYVHRLVLEAFVGPCPAGMETAHGDGNSSNNALSNLRWATPPNNHADKVQHGTDPKGERNGMARLTEDDVREIRRRYRRVSYHESNAVELMREFGLTRSGLLDVVKRRKWAHVD